MNISHYFGLRKGHAAINYIDINVDGDTELFLDPCLIQRATDPLSRDAACTIADYEDALFENMRNGYWNASDIFDAAHEVHDTKLGYGNGRNGKGKTADGMRDSLARLCTLANNVHSISRIQDISILVEDFAEDCLSDLLTNILHHHLRTFTYEQMLQLGKEPDGVRAVTAWDRTTHSWRTIDEPYWLVNGKSVLLVPKHWVRKHFLFKAHQYLFGVIIERIRRNDPGYRDMPKKVIADSVTPNTEHWEYDAVIDHTQRDPDALSEYHTFMSEAYAKSKNAVSDAQLDDIVYGHTMTN